MHLTFVSAFVGRKQIDGNDHVVTDSVIFAYTSIGIEVNSPGSILHNVHVGTHTHTHTHTHTECDSPLSDRFTAHACRSSAQLRKLSRS